MMNVQPVILAGRHVRLEPLQIAHHAALAALLEPGLLRWFPDRVEDADDLRAFMQQALDDQAAGTALPFATIDRASGAVAGTTRFGAIARPHRRAEIGWTFLGRAWQRSPLNTEAKLLLLTHAFETWEALRVELKTDSLNVDSLRAIARLGAKEDGTFRNHMVTSDGRVRHTVWFSVVAEDWPNVKRRLTERLARE